MIKLSDAQSKILRKVRDGAILQFDTGTGRYVMREGSSTTHPGLRTVEALLRAGALEQSIMGQCRLVDQADAQRLLD